MQALSERSSSQSRESMVRAQGWSLSHVIALQRNHHCARGCQLQSLLRPDETFLAILPTVSHNPIRPSRMHRM